MHRVNPTYKYVMDDNDVQRVGNINVMSEYTLATSKVRWGGSASRPNKRDKRRT